MVLKWKNCITFVKTYYDCPAQCHTTQLLMAKVDFLSSCLESCGSATGVSLCYIDFQNLKLFPHWNQHGDTVTIELWYGHRSIIALYWFSKFNTVSSLKPTWGYCYSINFTCHSGLCRDRGSFCAVSYININLSFFSPKSVELLFFRNILHLPIVIYIFIMSMEHCFSCQSSMTGYR